MSSKPQKPSRTPKGLWLRGKTYWLAESFPGRGQQRISLGTPDLAEALTKAKEIRAFPERFFAKTEGSTLELFLEHQKRRGISDAHMKHARVALTELAGFAPKGRLEDLSPVAAQKWWAGLLSRRIKSGRGESDKQLGQKAAKSYLGHATVFYKWAVNAGHLPVSPVALIIAPKIRPKPRRTFLEADDAKRVIGECTDEDLKFCLFCALHCGLRKGEVIASRPHWFDMKAGLLHVQNEEDWLTKDRDNRTIPLTREFLSFLKIYGIRSPYMLRPDVESKPKRKSFQYRTDFKKLFAAHMKALELPKVTFHDLRRTFASLHASHGTPLYHIAKWLGDEPGVVERTYAHLVPAHDRINGPWS